MSSYTHKMHYFRNMLKFVPANNRSPKVLTKLISSHLIHVESIQKEDWEILQAEHGDDPGCHKYTHNL